ncbi:hypothetical protein D9M70_448880 [compost metagenome]
MVGPEGIIDGEHQAIPGGVIKARMFRVAAVVLQIRKGRLVVLDALPLTFAVGSAQVGVIDHLETARAAELGLHHLAGLRIFHQLTSPPATGLQVGLQGALEGAPGGAVRQGLVDLCVDVLEQIQLHRLGDGKAGLVLFLPDVPVIKADGKALLAVEVDGFLGRQRLQLDLCHQTAPVRPDT